MELAGSSTLTTSATAQTVLANRSGRRVAFTISNYGATTAWICLSDVQTAAVGVGIPLAAGSSISDEWKSEKLPCWQGAITAVDDGAGGATTISTWERVKA